MATYTLKTFVRAMSLELLQSYLATKGIGHEIDWSEQSAIKRNDSIHDAIEACDEALNAEVQSQFREVYEQDTEKLAEDIIRAVESESQKAEFISMLEEYHGAKGFCFWVKLCHSNLYEDALWSDIVKSHCRIKRTDIPECVS